MIEVNNLTYSYPGSNHPAVNAISFHVARGEIFGFLGPSGAGKSTTQKILIGVLKGYSGQVTIGGRPLEALGNDYYQRVGVSFELPRHYQKLSGLENLAFFRALYAGETEDPHHLLALVGLADDADTPVAQYSKGMQMRLNFARALLNKPDLLFLDEPTSGLDPGNAVKIKRLIAEQKALGRTIFLTTHNMAVADELADRVAFLVDGQIAALDTPRQLKLAHGEQQLTVEYRQNGSTAAARFALAQLGHNADFINLLRSREVETIHSNEPTLEDIFIRVTGRSLA